MKNLLFILIFCFAFNKTDSSILKNKVTFTYHSFSVAINTSNYTYLIFSIQNNTKDTVYLSDENIKIKVINNKNILVDERKSISTSLLCALPFPPYFGSDKEYEGTCIEEIAHKEKMNAIKNKFSISLYNKNFKPDSDSKTDKNFVIDAIVNRCIVLLPKQTVNYSTFFNNKNFDKTCIVTANYLDNGIFTSYQENGGKVVYIKY